MPKKNKKFKKFFFFFSNTSIQNPPNFNSLSEIKGSLFHDPTRCAGAAKDFTNFAGDGCWSNKLTGFLSPLALQLGGNFSLASMLITILLFRTSPEMPSVGHRQATFTLQVLYGAV